MFNAKRNSKESIGNKVIRLIPIVSDVIRLNNSVIYNNFQDL